MHIFNVGTLTVMLQKKVPSKQWEVCCIFVKSVNIFYIKSINHQQNNEIMKKL